MTNVLAIANQKGGVAKSTTTAQLGAELSAVGNNVLMIDLDSQASLTSLFDASTDNGNLSDVLGSNQTGTHSLADIIQQVGDKLYLAPSSDTLAQSEAGMIMRRASEQILYRAIEPIESRYDWILIDCQPGLGLLLSNAILAADNLLIPTTLERLPIDGLKLFLQTVVDHKIDFEDNCADVLGVVVTRADMRTILSRELLQALQKRLELKLFDTIIPARIAVNEAAMLNQTLREYDPDGPATKAYSQLTQEIIGRW